MSLLATARNLITNDASGAATWSWHFGQHSHSQTSTGSATVGSAGNLSISGDPIVGALMAGNFYFKNQAGDATARGVGGALVAGALGAGNFYQGCAPLGDRFPCAEKSGTRDSYGPELLLLPR